MRKLITFFRTLLYSLRLKVRFRMLRVYGACTIVSPSNFKFKKGLRINHYSYINASGGVIAGKNLTISAGAKVLTSSIDIEQFMSVDRSGDYHTYSSIMFGDNVWLGAGSIILPGITLSDRVIVAAGAVVTKSFTDADIILAGVPASIVKRLS
jgi:acetyltransferase-like isoleucine patch superfamily enzyme